jgi:hypothetical protein
MREELQKREGQRGVFRATFQRRGHRTNHWGTMQTALLVDVRDESGAVVADHLWFIFGDRMRALKLQPGDQLRFVATVATYFKRAHDFDWNDGDVEFEKDYRLIYPSNMRLLGGSAGNMPLFDEAVSTQPSAVSKGDA